MPIKYLCLDDEAAKVVPIIRLLQQANADLVIEVRTPAQFDEEVRLLGNSQCDGLLLDLRLDRAPDADGKRVHYRALSLAQELRTRMTEGEMPSYPLILWSVDDNFKLSYDKDETSHDLFDKQYYKADVTTANRTAIAREMIALAVGYKTISLLKSRTVKGIYSRLIGLPNAFDTLDERIAFDIAENRSYPAHVFARSIMRNLLAGGGPLIDEKLLAARLGIDPEKSTDWEKLKTKFADEARYTGVFSEAWPRWWMFKIAAKWREASPTTPLQRLEAAARVDTLKKAFRLTKLEPATPIEESYDTRFWHICKFLKAPVSPTNAVQLAVDRREWQDGVYASLKVIIDRLHKANNYEIHAFERARINELMAELKSEEKRV